MADEVDLVEVNTTADQYHVGWIERVIRTIKEHEWSTISEFPLKYFHKQEIINLIFHVVMWLNTMPANKFIYENYSQIDIFIGQAMDYTKHWKAVLGEYIKSSEYAIVTNAMKTCTNECITLRPSGNIHVSTK